MDIHEDPFAKYIVFVVFNIILGIVLGIWTDTFVNKITKNLSMRHTLFVQITIVAFVIWAVKKVAKHIHQEPLENYSYDVIFISVYIGSQANINKFLEKFSKNNTNSNLNQQDDRFSFKGKT